MSHEEEIIFKIYKSAYGERWYVKRLQRDYLGGYIPLKKYLCKNGSIIDELITYYSPNTNYFSKKQDAIDTIHEFYSVVEVIE